MNFHDERDNLRRDALLARDEQARARFRAIHGVALICAAGALSSPPR